MKKKWMILAAAAAVILFAELGLRVAFDEKLKIREYPLVYQPDDFIGYRYIPNARGRISIPGLEKEFRINEAGFPGPSYPVSRDTNALRIAIVDASNGTGIWMPGERPYRDQLEELLAEHTDRPVEVLNFSIDGQRRDKFMIRLICEDVVRYGPDAVFFMAGIPLRQMGLARDVYQGYVIAYDPDDPTARDSCRERVDRLNRRRFFSMLYRGSYIVRAACRFYANRFDGPAAFELDCFIRKRYQWRGVRTVELSAANSVRELQMLDEFVKRHGCLLVVAEYSLDGGSTLGPLEGTGVLTWTVHIPPGRGIWNPHDLTHLNESGHAIVARSLLEAMTGIEECSEMLESKPDG
jgi:hypothetical protein